MFAKSKITQSMIDAVNSVIGEKAESNEGKVVNNVLLDEAAEKVATPTGMKVYGSSYGNSAKAKRDQTKSSVDTLKGPKDKEMKEELKGDQHKIDANKNDKIDAQDFDILRSKKKVKEEMSFAAKLLETVRKSDVPAYLRKAKGDTPLTVADVKAPKKDSISAPENLAKARNEEVEHLDEDNLDSIAKKHGMEFKKTTYGAGMKHPKHGEISINRYGEWHHTGTKAQGDSTNKFASLDKHLSTLKEEVEHLDELSKSTLGSYVKKASVDRVRQTDKMHAGTDGQNAFDRDDRRSKGIPKAIDRLTKEEAELDEQINEVLSKDASAGDWIHDFVHSDNPKFAGKSKAERKKMALGAYYGKQNEAYVNHDDAAVTTDTLAGRMPGGKINSFKSYKLRVRPLDKEGTPGDDTPKIVEPESTPARKSHEVHESAEAVEEKVIAGTPGWEPMKKDVTDKSGAVHTPMSRAKDLARTAFKKLQKEVK